MTENQVGLEREHSEGHQDCHQIGSEHAKSPVGQAVS